VYLALIADFPLRPLRSDDDLDRAIAVINRLIDRVELTQGEQDYLDVLARLVEDYESEHIEIPPVSGVAMLRHLMEANGLKQADLADLFGGKSVISEVLSGKRSLSKQHIQRLSARFGLPADVFLTG
jgi:HTH-type transcriptional regulator/antitoxin HigA